MYVASSSPGKDGKGGGGRTGKEGGRGRGENEEGRGEGTEGKGRKRGQYSYLIRVITIRYCPEWLGILAVIIFCEIH